MALVASVLVTALNAVASAQEVALPEGFALEPVVRGLRAPVDLSFAPDGRIFFAEKEGIVRIADEGELFDRPFIDIRGQVNALGDRGLVGIAVHPRFPEVPWVYLAFVYDPPELAGRDGQAALDGGGARVSRLIRVTADPAHDHNVAVPGSDVILLGRSSTYETIGDPTTRNPETPSCGTVGAYVQDCLPVDEHSHSIGRVRFGPDGALYIGSGDGADYKEPRPYHRRAQDLDSLAGKLLRIDPITGRGLPDNPFFDGDPDSNRSKVLTFGHRNPYSFTFHPDTWEPVVGDVGWAAWEEINVGRGRNFGWPCFEGAAEGNLRQPPFSDFDVCQELYGEAEGTVTRPALAYLREGSASAIIVGDFFDGAVYPERYRGRLFVADYLLRWIRTVRLDAEGEAEEAEPFATVNFPVHVVQLSDGHMAYLNVWEGALMRVRYESAPDNRAPRPFLRASRLSGVAPLIVDFDASASRDPDGDPIDFSWSFGDGRVTEQRGAEAQAYFFEGEHVVTLTTTDTSGAKRSTNLLVRAGVDAPSLEIVSPSPSTSYELGEVITFEGSARDAEGRELPAERLHWRLFVHTSGGTDPYGLPPRTRGSGGSIFVSDRGDDAVLELCLTASDEAGVTAQTCREIRLR